ncbi:hypothetical protein JG688_00006070 [Phytophthora aleatoria]|uniref:Uncharacterized protein n=1 Tax=Phytophthora aleatoria TaxID=2496075 RepID=A0A8J5J8Z1_9STRA|nr:hypothetical protein JG688_00006070 [Phytophthora aleatoria]
MEVAQVTQVPTLFVDTVEPVNDKHPTEVTPIEAVGNNHTESNPPESAKTPEPELVLQAPAEENRPVDVAAAPSTGDTTGYVSEPLVSPRSGRLSEGGAEVVTPAGTVEAPASARDTPSTEAAEKEAVALGNKASETETVAHAVEHVLQHETITPALAQATTVAAATEPTPSIASAPSPEKKTKSEKKQTKQSLASEEVLNEVQKFLTLQIVENRCSSHTKEIHEFVETHLNEKQRKRYIAPLIECIMQNFTQEATAKGEEVAIDVQSNICLIELLFITLGRRSPLEDMYTAEEEEMLDLLFHSNSSNNLPIDN